MGEFYAKKIKNQEINKKTGKAWTLNDVPAYWRAATQRALEK